MSAAAEQLGLASPDPDQPAHRDLDQALTLITALAGWSALGQTTWGPHAAAFPGCWSQSQACRPGPSTGRRPPRLSSVGVDGSVWSDYLALFEAVDAATTRPDLQ